MKTGNINPNIKNSPKELKERKKKTQVYYREPVDEDVALRSEELIKNLESKVSRKKTPKVKKGKNGTIILTKTFDMKSLLMVSGCIALILIILGLTFMLIFGHKSLNGNNLFAPNASVFVWDNWDGSESQGHPGTTVPTKTFLNKSVNDSDIKKQSIIEFNFAEGNKSTYIYKIGFKVKVTGTGYISFKVRLVNYDSNQQSCEYYTSKLIKKTGDVAEIEILTNFRFNRLSGSGEYEKQKLIIETSSVSSPSNDGSFTEDSVLGFGLYNLKIYK